MLAWTVWSVPITGSDHDPRAYGFCDHLLSTISTKRGRDFHVVCWREVVDMWYILFFVKRYFYKANELDFVLCVVGIAILSVRKTIICSEGPFQKTPLISSPKRLSWGEWHAKRRLRRRLATSENADNYKINKIHTKRTNNWLPLAFYLISFLQWFW